jgi:hypothetical protein
MCSAAMRNQFVLALAAFGCPMQMQEQVCTQSATKFFASSCMIIVRGYAYATKKPRMEISAASWFNIV